MQADCGEALFQLLRAEIRRVLRAAASVLEEVAPWTSQFAIFVSLSPLLEVVVNRYALLFGETYEADAVALSVRPVISFGVISNHRSR
jgi:hypothetical protein